MTRRLTVVGSFAVGLTIRTPELPIFGQTILGSDFDFGPGGKGSNQAVALARLGMDVSFVSCVGRDELAQVAHSLYKSEGVNAENVVSTDERATGAGIIVLNTEGENFIILDMGANELMDRSFVENAGDTITDSAVVMTVLEIPKEAALAAMEIGASSGAITVMNPAPALELNDGDFRHISYLTPNESELRILLGLAPDDPTGHRDLAVQLRERGVGTVIVTMGDQGALVLGDGLDTVVPTRKVDVVDTTGAGDAFNAGFAAALAEGRPVLDCVENGALTGAHACTRLGVVPSLATRKELTEFAAKTSAN